MQKIVTVMTNTENIERYKAVIDLEKFAQPVTESLLLALRADDRILLMNHHKKKKDTQ